MFIDEDFDDQESRALHNLWKNMKVNISLFERPIPDYGDLMDIGKWIDDVHKGLLIDEDGIGYYSNGLVMYNLRIRPTDVFTDNVKTRYTNVVWFNK